MLLALEKILGSHGKYKQKDIVQINQELRISFEVASIEDTVLSPCITDLKAQLTMVAIRHFCKQSQAFFLQLDNDHEPQASTPEQMYV